MATNVRYKNGNLRRKNRARLKAMGLPCAICGRPIHYDEPSDSKHPLSFVIDEKIPVSKATQYGYDSARAAAEDFSNLQPAHYICNQMKSNKINFSLHSKDDAKMIQNKAKRMTFASDGDW